MISAFYDLNNCPLTYDAAVFMAVADAYTKSEGHSRLSIYVVPADTPDGFRWISPKDKKLPPERKLFRLQNLILPLSALLPRCVHMEVLPSREAAGRLRASLGDYDVFPLKWNLETRGAVYHMDVLFRLNRAGIDVQAFRVPSKYLDWAKKKRGETRKLATITLRQSDMQPARNSNLAEWQRVRLYLESKGYRVVTVPDTEALLSDNHGPWEGEISEGASVDLLKRAGLYEAADINLMVCGGPATLATLNPKAPLLMCNMICESHKTTKREWVERLGFRVGEQPGWLKPHQKVLWASDTFDNLLPELERLTA